MSSNFTAGVGVVFGLDFEHKNCCQKGEKILTCDCGEKFAVCDVCELPSTQNKTVYTIPANTCLQCFEQIICLLDNYKEVSDEHICNKDCLCDTFTDTDIESRSSNDTFESYEFNILDDHLFDDYIPTNTIDSFDDIFLPSSENYRY